MCKFPKVLVASAAVSLGLTLSVSFSVSAQSNTTPKSRSHGYINPKTGVFHLDNQMVADATVPSTDGTFIVTLHITLKTSLERGDKVGCSLAVVATSFPNIIAGGSGNGASYTEEASADASVSSSTATCVLTIPYSWLLPAQPRIDSLSGSYTATITSRGMEGTAPKVLRSSGSDLVDFTFGTIPAGTSTFSVNVTLIGSMDKRGLTTF
jgi:hypothetical protein